MESALPTPFLPLPDLAFETAAEHYNSNVSLALPDDRVGDVH
jgi:hypothetical protein